MNIYVLGQTVLLRGELRDEFDALIDASSVRCLVIGPGQSASSTLPITPDGTGKVKASVLPETVGIWRYRFETTSGVLAADEGEFQVIARGVPAP